jgi:FtsZ-binding cell division protein ZapB
LNGKSFGINFSLFCCVSDKFQTMSLQEEELSLTIPNQHLPCFISFLDIFKGLPFYFEKYSLESVSYLIHLLGLSSLSQFICENFPSPQNIQEALEFLSNHSCQFYPNIFDESMKILIYHFSEIRTAQFLKLSNFVLEKLFQSPQLKVDNEDILFNLVVDLIGRDPNKKILIRCIFFPGVSSSHLTNFFNNFPAEEIDSDLFESLKTRLFCDIYFPHSILPLRWLNPPIFHSKEEIDSIFQLLQYHFQQTINPVQLIQPVINKKYEMKKTIQKMEINFKNEKENMTTQLQNVQNEKENMKNELQNVDMSFYLSCFGK